MEKLIRDLETLSVEETRELYRVLSKALDGNGAAGMTRDRATQQRESRLALHAEPLRLPVANPSDGLSNRDHDRVL